MRQAPDGRAPVARLEAEEALRREVLRDRELLDRERRALTRLSRLQALTAALCEAVTPDDVARVALEHVVGALGARDGGWWSPPPTGPAELLRAAGLTPAHRDRFISGAGGLAAPIADVLRHGEAAWFGSRGELAERYPGVPAAGGELALALLPLRVKGRCRGVFSFGFDGPRRFEPVDRSFLLVVARHAALALERARLYEAEHVARARAQEAARAREEVIAVVSHDLKNPLNAVLMSAALLRRSAGDPVRVGHHAEVIERSAHRMRNLVRDLLDLSRLEAGRFTLDRAPQPVSALLAETLALFQPIAQEKEVALDAHAAGAMEAQAYCDRERVLQVLSNLLGNALAFTPGGGRVTVRAATLDRELLFTVSDTGPGIAADEQRLVFERFWKSPASRDGSGLGLSIARGIVEAHGGRIWVESRPGQGAAFRFTLPLA
jgi:signal transduction histidine kinase